MAKFDVYDHSIDTVAKYTVQMEDYLKQYIPPLHPPPPPGTFGPPPPKTLTHCEIADIFQLYLTGEARTWAYKKHQEYTIPPHLCAHDVKGVAQKAHYISVRSLCCTSLHKHDQKERQERSKISKMEAVLL
ncbi:hypothetical protein BDK51DRAFT_28707 [Blyttiomyces helicus]|uniref:Uncharacterized protein n=1 Tax=Blyttiomyces helicus TaxID=388810 RepID=A0A4V1IR40_9FUNG|nr:hypothetical protein BDK51DRAFT_28707 [Blyttiomyces helicus]|eukprot:RKO88727.1 hypothetical protein BDK51DRAFT_28707 [Blyttiomyces helicus]